MPDPQTPMPGSLREVLREVGDRLQQPTESLRQLLQQVVARAVAAVGAAEGSILVPDEHNHLRFLVAHSPTTTKLVGLRVPISGSIAGYVFGTGQMMAVGDLTEERTPQFYAEIDRQVGVATRTYLVVPILFGTRVAGVATYVNRPGQPPFQPFQKSEMELARGFAGVEALLLRFLERTRQLSRLAAHDLQVLEPVPPPTASLPAGQDSWVRVLQMLDSLPDVDQALCADLIRLIAERHSQEGT
jgi:GAF domain-containing protein